MSSQSNTTINRYGSIAAEIYDIDKPIGAMPDTAFHLEGLADIEGPILEPACGTGRALVPLLLAGHDVTGFDLSEEMLGRCRARCAERGFAPDLSRQTFEAFTYDRAFAAIIVPVGSFTLIGEFETAMAVLRRFHDHLAPSGRLVVDMTPMSDLADRGADRRSWTAENGDLLTIVGQRTATDWLHQRVDYTCRYERWRDGSLVEAQLEPMTQRHWGIAEFTLALGAAGFSDVTVSGGYQRGRPPRARDRVLTFEALR